MKKLSGNAGEFFITYPEEQKEGKKTQTCLFPINSASRKPCRVWAAQVEYIFSIVTGKRHFPNTLESNASSNVGQSLPASACDTWRRGSLLRKRSDTCPKYSAGAYKPCFFRFTLFEKGNKSFPMPQVFLKRANRAWVSKRSVPSVSVCTTRVSVHRRQHQRPTCKINREAGQICWLTNTQEESPRPSLDISTLHYIRTQN